MGQIGLTKKFRVTKKDCIEKFLNLKDILAQTFRNRLLKLHNSFGDNLDGENDLA